MFWEFRQINSGGWFDWKVGQSVLIEAASRDEANERALDKGVYFDGVDEGMDCPCCGDRWYRCWEDDGEKKPQVWVSHYKGFWGKPTDVVAAVHYQDGRERIVTAREIEEWRKKPGNNKYEGYLVIAPQRLVRERKRK